MQASHMSPTLCPMFPRQFLVGRDGKVIDRYLPTTAPLAIVPDIEKGL